MMLARQGFSLAELLVAILLMGVVVMAAASAELTSRQFFNAAEEAIRVQDEAKVAMEHMVRNIQRGIGDVNNPAYTLFGPTNRIRVNIDGLFGAANGRFGDGVDGVLEYEFDPNANKIVFDPNADDFAVGDKIDLTAEVIVDCVFQVGVAPNVLNIIIVARRDPGSGASLQNPEVTINSSVLVRGMSGN